MTKYVQGRFSGVENLHGVS